MLAVVLQRLVLLLLFEILLKRIKFFAVPLDLRSLQFFRGLCLLHCIKRILVLDLQTPVQEGQTGAI